MDKVKKITKYDKRIMDICKTWDSDKFEDLQSYLKNEYYINSENLDYTDLFRILMHTCSHIFEDWQIIDILQVEIPKKIEYNIFWGKRENITPKELCEILISKIMLVKVKDKDQELFQVVEDSQMV